MTINKQSLAHALADHYLHACCEGAVYEGIGEYLEVIIKEAREDLPRQEFFDALFKVLRPHEESFAEMVQGVWEEEERIIVANLKKLGKRRIARRKKDVPDQVMYPRKEMEEELVEQAEALFLIILSELGQQEIDRLGLEVTFNVTNPEIMSWLREYKFLFAEKFENESQRILRELLAKSMEQGDTIPEIIHKIREQFTDWSKYRAERVARTETARAYNQANLNAYRQAGITKKIWYANPGACEWCEPMDGKVMGIEENYYDIGSTIEMQVEGKTRTLALDYEDITAPPLHPNCRCSIAPQSE